jgi:RNA polymerase sigma-70 factor (ECF subfamily)
MWILRCAYNRSINRRKHLLRRQYYAATDLESVEDNLAASGTGIVSSHEAKDLVVKGFESLNSAQKKVIQLAYFEGLSLREIAEQMGESLGNVRHHYYRGLDRLRDFLREAEQKKPITGLAQKEISDAQA